MEEHGIAERLRGGGEDEQLRIDGELLETSCVAPFDLTGHRLAAGKTEPAREVRGVPRPRQSSSASGLPWLSMTICSQTAASSGPCTLSSRS